MKYSYPIVFGPSEQTINTLGGSKKIWVEVRGVWVEGDSGGSERSFGWK